MKRFFLSVMFLLIASVAQAARFEVEIVGSAWNDATNAPLANTILIIESHYTNTAGQECILYSEGSTDANGELVQDVWLTNPDKTKGLSVLVYPNLGNWIIDGASMGTCDPIVNYLAVTELFVRPSK